MCVDRHSQQKHYPPARRLYFRIIPGMPRLELSFDDMPTNAFEGELLRVSVTLKNVGQLPAKHLKVALDHADVALVKAGEPAQEQASVMDALTGALLCGMYFVGRLSYVAMLPTTSTWALATTWDFVLHLALHEYTSNSRCWSSRQPKLPAFYRCGHCQQCQADGALSWQPEAELLT